jgi:hypothetical protein
MAGPAPRVKVTNATRTLVPVASSAANAIIGAAAHSDQLTGFGRALPRSVSRV